MNKVVTLTIVIPVFNESLHLKRCLDSIAAQSHLPSSVMVVDNNSEDDSVAIAKNYPYVTVLHEKSQGIVFARNAGFDAVKSDIIGRIDADTILPTNWVRQVCDFYASSKNSNNALTGGGYFYNFRLPRLNGWLYSQLAYRFNRLVIGHYILWGSNMAMPTAMWHTVKSSLHMQDDLHEDIDLAIHCHRLGYGISYRENLRVGVKLKRVWEDRWQQRMHLARWPRTMRIHGYKLWWMGSIGNVFLPIVGEPFFVVTEFISRLLGRPTLPR